MSCTQRLQFVLSVTSLFVLSSGLFSGCALLSSSEEEKQMPPVLSEDSLALLQAADQDIFLLQFDEAMRKVDQVLAASPNSREALNMVFKIRLSQLNNEAYRVDRQREEAQARASLEAMKKGLLPEEKPLLDRSLIALKPGITQEEELKIKEKLQRKVAHLDLQDADLDKVLFEIFKEAEINIALDPGNFAGKKFTIRGKEMTVRYVLENIARTQGLNFTVDDENVWIVSSEKPVFISRVYRLNTGVTRKDTRGGYEGLGTLGTLSQVNEQGSGGGAGGGGAGGGFGGGGGGAGGGFGGGATQGNDEKEKTHLELLIEQLPKLVPSWPEGSELYFDKKQNIVIVKSTREAVSEVDKILQEADRVAKQVSIEARFVEIRGEENFDFGVSFNFNEETSGFPDAPGFGEGTKLDQEATTVFPFPKVGDPGITSVGNFKLKGVLRDKPFNALLSAIERTTFANTVSVPSVTVSNNNTATLGVTKNAPYIEDYDVENVATGSVGTGFNNITQTEPVVVAQINDENFEGRALVVTPSIGADGKTITMFVQPVIRTDTGVTFDVTDAVIIPGLDERPTIERPIFETKFITTQVSVQDGDTVIIGGLITNESRREKQKIPILGDLPLLGVLFRSTSNVDEKINLYIFITARVVSPDGSLYQ